MVELGEGANPTEAAKECVEAMSNLIQGMIASAVAAARQKGTPDE
jgi:hypothetical protein